MIYLKKIIKSCKATNLEFLKLKEKLGLCFFEDICDEQKLSSMSKKIIKEEKSFTQHDVENKQLYKENEKIRKEKNEKLREKDEQLTKKNVVKDSEIKESIEKSKEIKSSKKIKIRHILILIGLTNILAIIDSNKFAHKN